MIAIYRSLEETGVPVLMATHGGTFEFVLEREGIPYETLEPRMSKEECHHFVERVIDPRIPAYNRDTLEALVQSEMQFFKQRDASAVLIGFTLSAVLSARGAGLPLVVTHLGSFVPPVLERGMFAFAEFFDGPISGLLPRAWVDGAAGWVFQRVRWQTPLFNAVADKLRIERVRSTLDVLMGDLTLVTDVPEILGIPEDELEDWRPSDTRFLRPTARLKYAGAIFARLFGDVPEDVSDFLQTEKPKVFVTLSSSRREYVERVVATLARLDVRAVVTATVHQGSLGKSDNILIKDFLPSHRVMPMCDLAIIHGGQGSVQTAISAGVPLIGFPLQPEQNFNLRQVERHGGGYCLSLRSLKRGKLRGAVDCVARDASYRTAMARLQAWQAARDGPLEVACAIRSLLQNGVHLTSTS
jgi:UDP:flavonoid glycosyltransferase YjiC (YdhE family)